MPDEILLRPHLGGFAYRCRVVPCPGQPVLDPVLFIGGAFQDMYAWQRHAAVLAPHATVVTVDLPGWGGAEPLPPSYGVDFLARAAGLAMERAGFARWNLVGASYGALIGHRLVQLRPRSVVRAAFSGIAGTPSAAEIATLRACAELLRDGRPARFAEEVTAHLMCTDPARPVRRREAVRRVLFSQLAGAAPQARRKMLGNLQRLWATRLFHPGPPPDVPTLVFTGEHDTVTPPAAGRRFAAGYPRGVFVTVREADHVVHLERDREYSELLLTHFRGEQAARLPFCRPYVPSAAA
ncbi:alpha/beta fold hydrolase [Streptomyces luteireticuli]|uniref:alpha/beta fold hydrolase n=1 Tax=Streptomyces luteireticuli TaxID=173858 RepID=UPI003558B98A